MSSQWDWRQHQSIHCRLEWSAPSRASVDTALSYVSADQEFASYGASLKCAEALATQLLIGTGEDKCAVALTANELKNPADECTPKQSLA